LKLHHHTAISITIGGILYLLFKSWGLAIACVLSGIFIDLDHIIDYVREHGFPFKIKRFFQICDEGRFNRIMLIFHGWEWLFLWYIIAWFTDWNPWITGISIGLTQHLLLDTFYMTTNFKSYSIIWRWQQNFEFQKVFGERCATNKIGD